MFLVKSMKNKMPLLIGQIHCDFKVTTYNFGQVYVKTSLFNEIGLNEACLMNASLFQVTE